MAAKPLRIQRRPGVTRTASRGKIRQFPLHVVRKTQAVKTQATSYQILGQVTKRGHTYRAVYDFNFPEQPVFIEAVNTRTKERTTHRLTHKQYIKFLDKLHAKNGEQFISAVAGHPEALKLLVGIAMHGL